MTADEMEDRIRELEQKLSDAQGELWERIGQLERRLIQHRHEVWVGNDWYMSNTEQ